MSRTPKTVSFRVPASTSSVGIVSSPTPLPPTTTLATPSPPEAEKKSLSPAPDLVADIINRPKKLHPSKIHDSQSTVSDPPPSDDRPPSRPSSEIAKVAKKSSRPRTSVPSYVRLARCGARSSSASGRDRSPLLLHESREKGAKTATTGVAKGIREQTNSATHQHVRSAKQDVSQLREHLLKVEEEIKNLNRGRSTLEISIQDSRKALSVNQQSISTQQKKSSRGEEVSVCVFIM